MSLADGREGGCRQLGRGHVIEPGHQDLVRDADTCQDELSECADGDQVISAYDRVRQPSRRKQRVRGLSSPGDGEVSEEWFQGLEFEVPRFRGKGF